MLGKPQIHLQIVVKFYLNDFIKTVENCGPIHPRSKIVGGEIASPHEFPWQVALNIDENMFCGGSILNEEWVLTSGYCVYR